MTDAAATSDRPADEQRSDVIEQFRSAMAGAGQLSTRMGIELIEVTPQVVTGRMPVEGNRQPAGLLNGGASCVLAETLGSVAATLFGAPDRIALGVDINATHHRPATGGYVIGTCRPLHEGRTSASYEIAISDEAGRRTCTARITCALRPAPGQNTG